MPKVELTDRFCQTAKALDGNQTDYFDTLVKGLSLLVSPGGTRTFYLTYSRHGDGKRSRIKIGRYPEIPLGGDKGARQRAKEMRASVGDGKDPVAEKKAHAASQTVADMVENYVARRVATKRSKDEIARRLRKNVKDVIGDVKLADLHRRDITRCIDAVKDRGAQVEANRVFEDLRAMVRWAAGRGDLDRNLCDGMSKPTETTERDRVLNADEIRTMWVALSDAEMRESTRRILRLCLVTGQRVGEIAGMTRDELDLTRGVWTIPAARSKNKREHVVPLSAMAIEIITAQIADASALSDRKGRAVSHFIFPAPGARDAVTAASVPKAVKRLEKGGRILGVPSWTPHDLRRSAATGMEEIGISPFIVGHVLNHVSATKSTVTSRVYARYDYAREKRQALDMWAEKLTGLIEGSADIVPLQVA